MPPDLPTLIKKFTKEVIRYNHTRPDIVAFARDYFSASVGGELEGFLEECEQHSLAGIAQTQTEAEKKSKLKFETGPTQQSKKALSMLRCVFNALDRDVDEALTLDELTKGIEGTPLGNVWLGILDRVVGDRLIEFEEFTSYFEPIPDDNVEAIRSAWLRNYFNKTHSPKVVDFLMKLYKKWDRDGNGTLALDELVESVRESPLSDDCISALLRSDVDQSGTISEEEFIAYMDDGIPDDKVDQMTQMFGL